MRRGTETVVAREMKAVDVAREYNEKSDNITRLLKRFTKVMNKHDKDFRKEQNDWSLVGDLGHVESKLNEIVRFLRG